VHHPSKLLVRNLAQEVVLLDSPQNTLKPRHYKCFRTHNNEIFLFPSEYHHPISATQMLHLDFDCSYYKPFFAQFLSVN
jgi:hypothetical protein